MADLQPGQEEVLLCARTLSQMNDGKTVVLHLDASMKFGENWLPTLNIEGDTGFYRFPDGFRREIAGFFGPDYQVARGRVDEANETLGVDPDRARDIVVGIIFGHNGPVSQA